jgi:hypothetical protein
MKYLIALALATALTACTNTGSGITPIDTPPDPADPIQPSEPPTQPLVGKDGKVGKWFSGQMIGKLLDDSTYKIEINLKENADGTFTNIGTGSLNYYRLWDLNQAPREKNLPHYDGYTTGERSGSVLNLSLKLNYNECFLKLKAYVSTDSKTLNFFSAKQSVQCSIATLDIALKPFMMTTL